MGCPDRSCAQVPISAGQVEINARVLRLTNQFAEGFGGFGGNGSGGTGGCGGAGRGVGIGSGI
jgi:hypothetical protein